MKPLRNALALALLLLAPAGCETDPHFEMKEIDQPIDASGYDTWNGGWLHNGIDDDRIDVAEGTAVAFHIYVDTEDGPLDETVELSFPSGKDGFDLLPTPEPNTWIAVGLSSMRGSFTATAPTVTETLYVNVSPQP